MSSLIEAVEDPWPFGDLKPLSYGVIYCDPPWQFKNWSEKGEGRNPCNHYDTMPIEELERWPVSYLARGDCALFMWVSGELLPECCGLMKTWGFTYKTIAFDWTKMKKDMSKPAIGLGTTATRKTNEICLLGVVGSPKRRSASVPQGHLEPRRKEHSRKPDIFYQRIEQLYDGPYVELFSRTTAPGWDVMGNETDKFELEAARLWAREHDAEQIQCTKGNN